MFRWHRSRKLSNNKYQESISRIKLLNYFVCAVFFCGGVRYLWSTCNKLKAGLLTLLFLVPLAFQAVSFGRLSNKVKNNNGSVWDFYPFCWKLMLVCMLIYMLMWIRYAYDWDRDDWGGEWNSAANAPFFALLFFLAMFLMAVYLFSFAFIFHNKIHMASLKDGVPALYMEKQYDAAQRRHHICRYARRT